MAVPLDASGSGHDAGRTASNAKPNIVAELLEDRTFKFGQRYIDISMIAFATLEPVRSAGTLPIAWS